MPSANTGDKVAQRQQGLLEDWGSSSNRRIPCQCKSLRRKHDGAHTHTHLRLASTRQNDQQPVLELVTTSSSQPTLRLDYHVAAIGVRGLGRVRMFRGDIRNHRTQVFTPISPNILSDVVPSLATASRVSQCCCECCLVPDASYRKFPSDVASHREFHSRQ